MNLEDLRTAIDELDDLIHNSQGLMAMSDWVRVDPEDLRDLVGRIRRAAGADLGAPSRAALEGLEQAVREARPARLRAGVKVHVGRTYDRLDEVRAHLLEDPRRDLNRTGGTAPPP